MDIVSKRAASYGIYKVGNKHRVVRNIKDFDTPKEANIAALKLARGDITEEDVLGEDYKTDINLHNKARELCP